MIRSISFLVLITFASIAYSQFWQGTRGPGGNYLYHVSVNPNGDFFTLSETMHRSQDDGANWVHVGVGLDFYNFVGMTWTNSGSGFLIMNKGLRKSSDNGTTWPLLGLGNYYSLANSPRGYLFISREDSLLISTNDLASWTTTKPVPNYYGGQISADMDGVVYINAGDNLYRSLDNGASWSKILNGLPLTTTKKLVYGVQPKLALLYLQNVLYISTDSGRVWTSTYDAKSNIKYIHALNKDTVYLITDAKIVHRSIDGGRTWSELDNHTFYGDFSRPPSGLFTKGNYLYALFYDRLYRTSVHELHWQHVPIQSSTIQLLNTTPSGQIYASSSPWIGSKFSKTWALDSVWNEVGTFNYNDIYSIAIDKQGIFYGMIDGWFKKSIDSARTWIDGFKVPGTSYKLAVSDQMIFIASNVDGVIRSSDQGKTWDQLNTGITKAILSLDVSDSIAYAGALQTFYRSTNHGWTWDEPIFPLISGSGLVRAIECWGPNIILGIDLSGTYFSSDYGLTWENHSDGLLRDTINQLVATPSGAVFAATTSGVYIYDPFKKTWTNVNDKTLNGNIVAITYGGDGRVYVGTHGDGVYRTTKTYRAGDLRVEENPQDAKTVSVHPNPARAEVQISFNIDKPASYRVVIYDLLGEVVHRGHNEEIVDVSKLRSGQYFLRILTDNAHYTLPLSIVR